ncbi:MAG TPA: cytochrome c oxidase assembly protein [Nocardioides sp.]|nr:cytochrome c oxidase assembly protein [Nocardioides sp.]
MPRLSWANLLDQWRLSPGWLIASALLMVGYLGAYAAARRTGRRKGSSVPAWRAVSFTTGCVLMWATVSSGVGGYAMAVFWMHMVLHLVLIMVVPALLVLGHPITVVLEGLPEDSQAQARRIVRSWPVTALTHQLTGLALYAVVIVATHLTGFMDQMTVHPWLMTGEQVLYVVTGFLFLLPLLGEEPIRPDPPYLFRLLLVLIAMVPDTLVGIVLLQTDHDPFPVMMGRHPAWAPPALQDVHTAGGLMWAGGDGLMMLLAIGLMLAVLTSPTRRTRMTGAWLDSARRANLADHTGVADDVDPDSDAALDAYNAMLRRLSARGGEQ